MNKNLLLLLIFISNSLTSQINLYVNPNAPSGGSANGTLANPYNNIATTSDLVAAGGGGNVIVIDGEYEMTGKEVVVTTAATSTTKVNIKPQTFAGVKFNFNGRFGFELATASRYITIEGFEFDGETDEVDYWTIVSRAFWGDDSVPRNGGLAIILDGQHISIKDNYIHDWYQKAIEIRDARYVEVVGNIISNIATTSLSGGHGIMRQQKGQEFFDNDLSGVYRWDIRDNLIFNVAQRIYSWVPQKGYIEMVIDEGKSILIDDPQDSDNIQENMSARIKNNIVAFGTVDHIRLKSTPNLEVSNNCIFTFSIKADGITDKVGDGPTPKFTNFICKNNAAQTNSSVFAIEIDNCIGETTTAGGTPIVSGNYSMDGNIKPSNQTGLIKLTGSQLFVNPLQGNFRINPSLSLPSTTGVESSVLDSLDKKVNSFGVVIAAENLDVDHLKLTQTILDNIPGINDGVTGNENVFENFGMMSNDYHSITYKVVNGAWKSKTNSKNNQVFELNEAYYTWYQSIDTSFKNSAGNKYERIRWGNSEIRQNQTFDPDWLTVSQITSNGNTLINGDTNSFILDGNLLIDFLNITPQAGQFFDLMIAKNLSSANANNIFDSIIFKGYTPNKYTLEFVDAGNKEVLRLTINPTSSIKKKNINNSKLILNPNPTNDYFKVIGQIDNQNLQIYNLVGQNMTSFVVVSNIPNGIKVNIENLTPGLYIVYLNELNYKLIIE